MSNRDWNGDAKSVFRGLGASNHSEQEREANDYYATEPKAMELLLEVEQFSHNVWECACGEKHLSKVLEDAGYNVRNSDLIERCDGVEILDFLSDEAKEWNGDIITNPPYKFATQFARKALDIIPDGNKVAMFLKIQFLEGKERRKLFEKHPPKCVYVSTSRLNCAKNGDFKTFTHSAMCYAWYVWEKGYKGDTIIKWIN